MLPFIASFAAKQDSIRFNKVGEDRVTSKLTELKSLLDVSVVLISVLHENWGSLYAKYKKAKVKGNEIFIRLMGKEVSCVANLAVRRPVLQKC